MQLNTLSVCSAISALAGCFFASAGEHLPAVVAFLGAILIVLIQIHVQLKRLNSNVQLNALKTNDRSQHGKDS